MELLRWRRRLGKDLEGQDEALVMGMAILLCSNGVVGTCEG
jgi:hypothetical protein